MFGMKNILVQQCLSVEGIPSMQHLDHKAINIDMESFSLHLTLILSDLNLQMILTYRYALMECKHIQVNV